MPRTVYNCAECYQMCSKILTFAEGVGGGGLETYERSLQKLAAVLLV